MHSLEARNEDVQMVEMDVGVEALNLVSFEPLELGRAREAALPYRP